MQRAWRLAFLAVALAPLAAHGDNSPQVPVATPGVGNGAIERFTIRFSQPMVPLGDPRAAAPVTVDCSIDGEGRWVDQQTYVHEFKSPLPGGTVCSFDLRSGLKSAAGFAVGGQRSFKVDAGGPTARAILPGEYGDNIEEDQVFLVAANLAPNRASVAANAYCAVDGLGEKIPVDVLDAGLPAKLLGDMGTDSWQVRNFLENAGLPARIPAADSERRAMLSAVVAVKCHRPLPPGRDMSLVWSGNIAGAGGKLAGADQRFDYSVRKPFTARFECSRVNPQAGCSPVEKAWVRFTAPIATALAKQIYIELPGGKRLSPKPDENGGHGDQRASATTADIGFAPPLPFATGAKLVLPAGIKDESGRVLANASRFPLDLRFDAPPPLVKFAADFGIIEQKEGGILPVTVRNVEPALQGATLAIGGQSKRIAGSDGEIAQWLRTVDEAGNYQSHRIERGDHSVTINDTGSKPVLTGSAAPLKIGLPGKGRDFEVVGIPLTRPGFYVVELASPVLGQALLGRRAPRYVATAALVTNMAVHFKWGRERSLAWVTTLDDGKPVAGAEVRITDSCTGEQFAHGVTDASGAVFAPRGLPQPATYGDCRYGDHPLMISARSGDDMSFTLTSWGEGIRPYDFDLPYGYEARDDVFHTVFDRALVRQGETIHMKHIVRRPVGAGFALSPGFTGTLRLSHSGSDTQFDLPLTIDANGIGETSWTAPQGAPMGDYTIVVIGRDGRPIYTDQSFRVDEYKLPTMRASVTGPKDAAIRPKSLPLDLYVGYLSGGGAPGLPVSVRVGWFASNAVRTGYESYSFGGKAISEGVRPMNGDGDDDTTPLPPTQTLPVTLGADGTARPSIEVPQTLDGIAEMQVEMDYQDANGETLTASKAIPIYPAAVQIGVKTDGWLMKHDDLRLRLVALDTQGKPVSGQRIDVALYSRQILTARRRLIGGFYAYDNQIKTTKLSASCSASSDAQGLAQCKLDPGVSGEVYAVATAKDAAGNATRTTASVWLVGEDDWWFGGDNGDRMDVVPEQQAYKAGDVARFQVRMPFREATALVTVEREGVLSSFVTQLSGTDPVVEVKMPGSYAPDVYVSVMAVRGRVRGFWSWLSHLAHEWGLPFGSAQPVEPTATVDLAKPSYRIGIARVKVGWEAHRLAVTVKADRERYAARDTAQVDVSVMRPDGKPAAAADVAFVAVDQALEQIAPNGSTDVLTAMMGERPLSVLTSTAQTQVVGKRHYGKKAVEAGGGGGAADTSALNRENFQPVLLWKGRLALDANGHARVAVPLNDALTAFKLVAVADDGADLFGSGEATIRAAQDLTIYSGLPQLVRSGDYYGGVFTLRNGSGAPMTVSADVALTPKIATGRTITVTIPAGGAVPVAWNLSAPDVADAANLRWQVRARDANGKAADRISVTQQIVPAVPIEVWAGALVRVGDANVPIAPPMGALPGRGSVAIRLDDTLAPPMAGVRAFMAAYPYDCFEQRLSRAIALGDNAGWTALAGDMPTYQAPDGLLRYWPSETLDGSEALTAYVLSIASEAGLAIPEGPRAKMVDALTAVIDGRLRHETFGDVRLRRVAAFAALARAGAARPGMLGQLGINPSEMPTAQLADYIAAIDHVPGLANAAALRASAEGVLRSRFVYEGTRLDLTDQDNAAWWLMSSADEGSIKALLAVLGRPGWNDEAPKIMVGVASRQWHGRWDTTTANAWGTIAARRFAQVYPAEAVAGVTTATLGTASRSLSWPLAPAARQLSLPLPPAATPLRLTQSGGAGPWATIAVAAAVPLKQPLSAGYRLTRQVDLVSARHPGQWTRGDVVRVTITVEATAERNWVVVNDPIPAGATIIGDQANQSKLLAGQGSDGGGSIFGAITGDGKLWRIQSGVKASYIERRNDSYRAYFDWVPRGKFTIAYVMRLNTPGSYSLPPTRVEAMYAPAIRAQSPNARVTIAAK